MNAIVAVDNNWCIGNDNELLYHIKNDMKHFKEITMNHVCVMGRKTFDSLQKKPLPNRINVVLTRDKNFSYWNTLTVDSIDKVLSYFNENEVYIIGGESIYKQFLPYIKTFYVTKILSNEKKGNKFIPNLDEMNFIQETTEHFNDTIPYQFITYRRSS